MGFPNSRKGTTADDDGQKKGWMEQGENTRGGKADAKPFSLLKNVPHTIRKYILGLRKRCENKAALVKKKGATSVKKVGSSYRE